MVKVLSFSNSLRVSDGCFCTVKQGLDDSHSMFNGTDLCV